MAARGGLGSLSVFLGLDTAEFTDGLSKAQQQAQKFADQVKSIAIGQELGRRLGQVADTVGRAFYDMTLGAIDAADHLNDLSKKTGVAVDTLGGIGFAASQAGGDLESASAAVGKLNKSLAEAASGNVQAGEAFKLLGVSVKDSLGQTRSANDVLVDLADKFEKLEDGPEKTALALRIFGKAGADIIPLLDDGGAALQRNIDYFKRYSGVTQETADAADQFNDTLGKIKLLSGAAGTTVASTLLPSFQALADAFLGAKESGDGFKGTAEGIKSVFDVLVETAANVAFVFLGVGREIGAVAASLAAIAHGDFAAVGAISDAVKEDGARARKSLDKFVDDYKNAGKKASAGVDPSDFAVLDQVAKAKGKGPRLSGTGVSDGSAELKKQLDGQVRLIQEFAKQQASAYQFANRYLEAEYQQGLTSQADFFAQEKILRDAATAAQLRSIDEEVAAERAALSKATKPEDRIGISNRIAEAEQKRAGVVAQAAQANALAALTEQRAVEQTQDAYKNLLATIDTLAGDEAGATAIKIAQQVRDAARLVTQAGGDPALVQQLQTRLTLQAQAAEQQRAYAKLVDETGRREAEIYADAVAGGKGELETLAAIRDARQSAIEQLQAQAAAAAELARQSGTDADIKRANDLALALKKAGAEIDPLATKFNSLFEDSFSNAFSGFLSGAKSAKEAFRDFAGSVINEIANIAAKNLARSLFGDTGGSSGIGGVLSGLFKGSSGGSGFGTGSSYGNQDYGAFLATGTNRVPYDGFRATLHKDEAVVPAKYNPAAGGGRGVTNNVFNNAPAQVSTSPNDTGGVDVLINAAADVAHSRVTRDFATGTGPASIAARARNGTGPGNLNRRA